MEILKPVRYVPILIQSILLLACGMVVFICLFYIPRILHLEIIFMNGGYG